MIRFGAVLCTLSLLIHSAVAADFSLAWNIAKYGGIVAAPGDTVTFTYGDNSDLWIHPTGDCNETGRIQLGAIGPGSATYNFTDADIGSPVTFTSSLGDNCENGQIITFTVKLGTQSPSTAPTRVPSATPSLAPTGVTQSPSSRPTRVPTTPYPTLSPTAYPTIPGATKFEIQWFVAAYGVIDAAPGDLVTFKYDEFSDVWIHPSNNCTQNDSIFVGPIGPGSATYIFTEADAGKMITFSSSVSDNCLRGQIISFNIEGQPTVPTTVPLTPAPSIAPQTAAPILAPVRTLPPGVPTRPPTIPPVAVPTLAPTTAPVDGTPTTTSAPVGDTPTTSAPVGGTPTTTAPVGGTPTTTAPVGDTPTTSAPVGGTPTTTAPVSTPAPVGGTPTTSAPVGGGTPTTSAPVGGTPTTTAPAPVGDTPTTSAPVDGGAPTTTAPVGDTPTTSAPVVPAVETARATDLSQTLLGMKSCDSTCQDAWIAQIFETTEEHFSSPNSDVTLVSNTPKITSVDVPKRLRRLQDSTESGVTITYDHTFEYILEGGEELEANDLATQALADESARTQFLADLKSRDSSFVDLTGVTAVDAGPTETPAPSPPTKAPTVPAAPAGEEKKKSKVEEVLSNTYVQIGIGVGVLLLLFICLMCCRKGRNEPGAAEKASSPRAATPKPNEPESVARSEPDEPEAPATREELIHVFAPPGKLGVVIDTPSDGASFVHAVKPTSIIADRIKVGDKLVAVDDEDVRSLSAINVSKLIGKKSSQPTRKLTVLRTISAEP